MHGQQNIELELLQSTYTNRCE